MLNNAHLFNTFSANDVIANFDYCDIEDVLPSVSDHSLVILRVDNFLAAKKYKRNIPSKKVFDYNKMSDN
ncbi:17793_t:CDS:2, partial [Funneliformis geosporum]